MADFFATYGFLIVSMLLAAMLGLSLYLPLMAGQLSLASPGFYALGGYIAAVMSTKVFTYQGDLFPIPDLLLEMVIAGVASACRPCDCGASTWRSPPSPLSKCCVYCRSTWTSRAGP